MSDQAIQLMHGDCLALMPLIPAGSVDCICTDLPYGSLSCAWDVVIPFAPLWEAYRRVIKADGAAVLFGAEPFASCLRLSNQEAYRYDWIWDKGPGTGHLDAAFRPLRCHETLSVFYWSKPTYNPQKRKGPPNHSCKTKQQQRTKGVYTGGYTTTASDVSGMKYPRSILEFPKYSAQEGLHPTQKPVALLEYLIRTYTNEGDTVLDSCMGSASTAIACMRTGRKFIGIEKDADYFEVACQRVKDEQRQGRLFTV